MKSPMDGAHSITCDCQTAWSVAQLPMESPIDVANPMRPCSDIFLPMDLLTDFKKSGGIFKILVRNSKKYRRNLMPPPKKILFYVLSVKLQYKTDHPPLRFIFSRLLSFLLFSSCKSFAFLIVFLLF